MRIHMAVLKKLNMRYIYIILVFYCFSCNTLINNSLDKKGVFDDKIELLEFNNDDTSIIFFPMHHIGTEKFYSDVSFKIDSLLGNDYYFYTETVKAEAFDDTILRKYKKITRKPLTKNGYMDIMDSLIDSNDRIKLEKNLINQPSYRNFGLDSINNKNVDVKLSQMINYYEAKYGVIELEDCDFETTLYEKTTCFDYSKRATKAMMNDMIVHFRNENILKELDSEKRNKIAIIYGKAHLDGVSKGLLERGFIIDSKD